LQFVKANVQPKNCKTACFANAAKSFLNNIPTLQKNKNTPTRSPKNTAENDKKTQY
jgi:hypothetical protein